MTFKKFMAAFVTVAAAFFAGVLALFMHNAKEASGTLEKAEEKAESVKSAKEKEIEETDASDLLAGSSNAEYHGAKQEQLKQEFRESLRARLDEKVHGK